MHVYVCQEFDCKNTKSENLLRKSLLNYYEEISHEDSLERSIKAYRESIFYKVKTGQICKGEKGKPYIQGVNIHFSISHSENIWICAVCDKNVGADIQKIRKSRYRDIADRFFTKAEKEYVDAFGEEGFFEIWVRKEAYVKYTGSGMGQGFSTFSVAEDGMLSKVTVNGVAVGKFTEMKIDNDVKGCICTEIYDKKDFPLKLSYRRI